jgi:hypothetical protein
MYFLRVMLGIQSKSKMKLRHSTPPRTRNESDSMKILQLVPCQMNQTDRSDCHWRKSREFPIRVDGLLKRIQLLALVFCILSSIYCNTSKRTNENAKADNTMNNTVKDIRTQISKKKSKEEIYSALTQTQRTNQESFHLKRMTVIWFTLAH